MVKTCCCLPTAKSVRLLAKLKEQRWRFLKQHADDFPPPVKASIPDKPRPVPLTDWEAAVAYWLHLAEIGNDTASALTAAKDNLPLSDFEIVSATDGVPTVKKYLIFS